MTVVFIIIIIIGILVFSKHLKDSPLPTTKVATSTPVALIKLASFSSAYRRGKYTLSGKIIVPTVCYTASATASLVPSTTPQLIRVNINVPIDTGTCLQLPATTTFSVIQKVAKNAVAHVYLNGNLATSTTI